MTAPAARETPDLSPPTVQSLGEQIYQTLRRALMRGEFAPGSRIIETVIADQLGVSRTPVREALSRLTVEGWLESRPNKGVIVAGITPRQVVERYALRQVLEGYAARQAAERVTDDMLDRLDHICETAARSVSDQQAVEFARLDGELHEGILRAAGNETLISIWRQYLHPARHTMFALGTRDHRERLVANHRDIVAALRQHDPDSAEKAMIAHLDYAFHNYLPESDLTDTP
ncbi:MAG TPA: GntR family transcriptional regulator [Chloroflexota bacterium]|nr:GntR family transcriptional regulator [Chloroflexota bacterium]